MFCRSVYINPTSNWSPLKRTYALFSRHQVGASLSSSVHIHSLSLLPVVIQITTKLLFLCGDFSMFCRLGKTATECSVQRTACVSDIHFYLFIIYVKHWNIQTYQTNLYTHTCQVSISFMWFTIEPYPDSKYCKWCIKLSIFSYCRLSNMYLGL